MALATLCLARARRTSDPAPIKHGCTAASLIAAKAGIKSVIAIWGAAFAGVSAVE
jgi:hypothetical protein